ncbi:MAG TPA: ankyrin repeat domain-containing protein [Patescibacteria group bacterium]|nr:ankyrin repeat domain-containing protein [Patescibacteria group bacterium]
MTNAFTSSEAIARAFKAADAEDIDALRRFLIGGGDPNARNADGLTLLQFAASKSHYIAATILLDGGADPNARGGEYQQTALHYAAERDYAQLIELLAEYKADPNLKDKHGQTPLHLAAHEGSPRAAVALTKAGADVFMKDRRGDTARDIATWRQREVLDFAWQEYIDIERHLGKVMHDRREQSAAWQRQQDAKLQGDLGALKKHNPGRFKLGPG